MKSELINMTRAWDKREKKTETPTEIEPMTSRTPSGVSIPLYCEEIMEKDVHLTEFTYM